MSLGVYNARICLPDTVEKLSFRGGVAESFS
jgi:hypothetical protein